MTDVIVVGSVNIDFTNYLIDWPRVGETVNTQDTKISLGGKGANQCVAASNLGSTVTMLGAIGDDSFGREAIHALQRPGITLQFEQRSDATTGMAFIDVVSNGSNVIRVAAGANNCLTTGLIEKNAHLFASAKVILLQNEIPLAVSLTAARIGRENGALVVMDPAPAPSEQWQGAIHSAFDILTPNAEEAHVLLGENPVTLEDALGAANAVRNLGARGAIVTMGGKGVSWSLPSSSGTMAAPMVNAVDTVAAGDCFNGALAAAYVDQKNDEEAIRFAMLAAALTTTKKGASEAIPVKADVLAMKWPEPQIS
ncbi:MAG: ribokinase [Sneathiella sp.]